MILFWYFSSSFTPSKKGSNKKRDINTCAKPKKMFPDCGNDVLFVSLFSSLLSKYVAEFWVFFYTIPESKFDEIYQRYWTQRKVILNFRNWRILVQKRGIILILYHKFSNCWRYSSLLLPSTLFQIIFSRSFPQEFNPFSDVYQEKLPLIFDVWMALKSSRFFEI